jgi:hypothetical protein
MEMETKIVLFEEFAGWVFFTIERDSIGFEIL